MIVDCNSSRVLEQFLIEWLNTHLLSNKKIIKLKA